MVLRVLVFGVICVMAWAPFAAADAFAPVPEGPSRDGDPTPSAPDAFRADWRLVLRPDASGLDVVVEARVHEIEVSSGASLTADEVRALPNADLYEAALEERLRASLDGVFPYAAVMAHDIVHDYGTVGVDADPYRPPVTSRLEFAVDWTWTWLGGQPITGVDAATVARALFEGGGVLEVDESLGLAPGTTHRFVVEAQPPMRVLSIDAGPAQELVVEMDNFRNARARSAPLKFDLAYDEELLDEHVGAGPRVLSTRTIEDTTGVVDRHLLVAASDHVARHELVLEVSSLPADAFDRSLLADRFHADRYSADALRLAVASGSVRADDLQAFLERSLGDHAASLGDGRARLSFDRAAFAASLENVGDGGPPASLVVKAAADPTQASDERLFVVPMGPSLGTVVASARDVSVRNDGPWRLEHVVVYPRGWDVAASGDEAHVANTQVDGRDAVLVRLDPQEQARVHVQARAAADASELSAHALQVAVLVGLLVWAWLRRRAAVVGARGQRTG
jgi:hypothetical protein